MNYEKLTLLRNTILIFCPIVLLVCISIVVVRWHDVKGSYLINTDSLEQTTGTILSSAIKSTNTNKGGLHYHYSIQYEFQMAEQVFHSDKVTFSYTGTKDGMLAEEYVKKYPVGKSVNVFYEAGDPSFSVLEPNVKDGGLLLVFLVGIFASVMIWVWAFFFISKTA